MDQIFDTRRVDNQGPVWNLPVSPKAMSFTYEYAGKTYKAEDALERTFTNALLIIKNGQHVTEPLGPRSPLGYRYQWWTIAGTDAYLALGLQGQSLDFLRAAAQWRP